MDIDLHAELIAQVRTFRRRFVAFKLRRDGVQMQQIRACYGKWRWIVARDDPRLGRELDAVFNPKPVRRRKPRGPRGASRPEEAGSLRACTVSGPA